MRRQKVIIQFDPPSTIVSASDQIKIEAKGLVVQFGKVVAVNNVSFNVHKGEILGLLGPSGCGKTTILRSLAGLEDIREGAIVLGGKVVSSPSKKVFVPPEKRRIGLVFQSYALWPHMTVHDNIAYCLHKSKIAKEEKERRIANSLELVGLPNIAERYPSQLSGGQQQRIALARSLSYEPEVLLLDEPLSNIDLKERERVRGELRSLLKRIGITSVFVTHDQEEAFVISDRILLMSKGEVIQEGSPEHLYSQPTNQFAAEFIGRANILPVSVEELSDDGLKANLRAPGLGAELTCESETPITKDISKVAVRFNEIALSVQPRSGENVVRGKVISREYRGSVTDHKIKVGDTVLTATTHKFCRTSEAPDTDDLYVQIPPAAIKPIAR